MIREKEWRKANAEMTMTHSISNLCTQRFRNVLMLVAVGRISAGVSEAGKRLTIWHWGQIVHMITVVTSATSRTFQHAKSQAFGAYRYYRTFSQESQTEGRGVPLTVLPPPPLDFKSVEGGKGHGHATPDEGEKAPEIEDPLSEYYAQARADREAQVSRFIGDPNC